MREEGDTGLAPKSRGKVGMRRIDDKLRSKVLEFYDEKCEEFGPIFAIEKLYEVDGMAISHETLRLWLVGEGKREWQRKVRS